MTMIQNITETERVCYISCLYLNNVSSIVCIGFPQKNYEKTIKKWYKKLKKLPI